MSDEPQIWSLDRFVDHFTFVHEKMPDNKFLWMLGAGASVTSGIPLAKALVDDWLQTLYKWECPDKENIGIEQWATPDNLTKRYASFKEFEWGNRASFYSRVYERRFHDAPENGYAYLEDVMSRAEPSPGYSILASALAMQPPRHNVVITTNFDNLIADALSIYTDTFPLVCGHESLTGFVKVALRRPLICKIHRDLLFGPQNKTKELKRLHDAWGMALRALFQHYTPIFIGYGGNDDTMMDLLESLEPGEIKGHLIWCYYDADDLPGRDDETAARIRSVVAEHNGALVPVPDFDLLMILLGETLKIGLLDQEIARRSNRRLDQYRQRVKALDILKYEAVENAFAAMARRSEGWWAWEQVAEAEKDPDRKELIYREALKHFPDSAELNGNLALFLHYERRNFNEAEVFYQKALELNPNDASHIGNYASFVSDVRGKHDEAEVLFQKSLQLNPNSVIHTTNYAELLISRGKLKAAAVQLAQVKLLNGEANNQTAANVALYEAILAHASGEDDTSAIKQLGQLLKSGFRRTPWSYDHVLAFAAERISTEDLQLYRTIVDGILDESKVPDVDALLKKRERKRNAAASQKSAAPSGNSRPARKKKVAKSD